MKLVEAGWLHEDYVLSIGELCELSGLSEAELRELVDYGVLAPTDPRARQWSFSADRLMVARSAHRLHKDFELDLHGVALMVTLLERVHALEIEIRGLRARLPGGLRLGGARTRERLSSPARPRARASRAGRRAPPRRGTPRA